MIYMSFQNVTFINYCDKLISAVSDNRSHSSISSPNSHQDYLCIHVCIKSGFCDESNFQYIKYIEIQLPDNNIKKFSLNPLQQ